MSEDLRLLERYAAGGGGEEEAFAELVRRHLDLVYSTALRMLSGDAHRAEDVAQIVFANLARRAGGMPPGTILAGWLHRDTCFTVLEVLRTERRRKAREELAMNEVGAGEEAVPWERLQPVLDEALEDLAEPDRHALLLRYFDRQSLVEVGRRLGLGESGASRRVAQALNRLRSALLRRGVTSTSAALALALSQQAVQAAPPELVVSILGGMGSLVVPAAAPAATLLPAGTAPFLLTLAMKTKLLVVGALVLVLAASVGVVGLWMAQRHRAVALADDEAWRWEQREHIAAAMPALVQMITYAAEHDGRLPEDLAGVDSFERIHAGRIPSTPGLEPVAILREKRSWTTSKGERARVYGYSDGHAVVLRSGDPGFQE